MIRSLLLVVLLSTRLFSIDFSFDFRESHNLGEVLKNPDQLPLLEDRGENGKIFYAENASVKVILPGGQIVNTTSQALMIDARPDGAIIFLKISGPIMPLDEVYEAGKKLYRAFHAPYDRIDKWKSVADTKGSGANSVLGGNYDGMYPPVYINIMHSMNNLYPWTISLSFGWNQIKNDKRDETWGRKNNPKPPPGLEVVSLEPPSGKTYNRADAWVEANRRQDELDKRLGQVRGPDGQLINGANPKREKRTEKHFQHIGKDLSPPTKPTSRWRLFILLPALLLTWLIFRLLSRR